MVGTTAGKSWTASQKSPLVAPLTRTIDSESIPPHPQKQLSSTSRNISMLLTRWWECHWDRRQRTSRTALTQGFLSASNQAWSSALLQRFTEFHGSGPTRKASDLFMLIRPVYLCLSTVFCFSPFLSLKPM